jgi:hypothetical protein
MRLLRGLGSQVLPCGCLEGIYETYNGPVVSIIDVRGGQCDDETHRVGEQRIVNGFQSEEDSIEAGSSRPTM